MARDRLQELRSKMKTSDKIEESGNSEGSMTAMQKTFDELHERLDTMQSLVEKMSLAHADIISSVDEEKNRLDPILDELQRHGSDVRNVLRELRESVDENDTSAVGRMKWSQYKAVSKRFSDLMADFHGEQMKFRDKCKERIRRQLQIMGQPTSDEKLEEMLEKGEVFVEGSSIFDIRNARIALEDVRARQRDIAKLEESIREMSLLFSEIAMLVEGQGEVIVRIEDQVEKTVHFAHNAQSQLHQAVTYKTSMRKKKIFCVALAALTIGLIVIIVMLVK